MFTIPEQFTNATKASFDAQISAFTNFAQKAFANVEKIVELNMNVAKDSFVESAAAARQLVTAKGPQEVIALTSAKAKPNADKAIAYGRELASITSAAQADFNREAEIQFAETRRKVTSLIEDVTKNAPAGTESVVAIVKTVVGNANAGFEQLSKTAKQAAETIEANVNNTVSKFSQVVEKATVRTASR